MMPTPAPPTGHDRRADCAVLLALVAKLLRDLRLALLAVALLLGAFQCLWAKVTERILGRLAPFFNTLAGLAGLSPRDVQDAVFEGPGKIVRTVIGGDRVVLDNAMDLLSVGYVHPLMQTLFCIWAVGRAAGAIAGELDRGTLELLLAQPLARSRLLLAHFCVDLVTIPALCLSLWAGNWVGAWLITPIRVHEPKLKKTLPQPTLFLELESFSVGPFRFGPFTARVEDPSRRLSKVSPAERQRRLRQRLAVRPGEFGPALWLVGGLIFALSGATMALSAAGRFRWRVLGLAVFLVLVSFLVNVLGQLWEPLEPLRPLTLFYYYQPQQVILGGGWSVTFPEWFGEASPWSVPMPAVLYGVGLLGYLLALWTFHRRDLPAPL